MSDRTANMIGTMYLLLAGVILGFIGNAVNEWLRDRVSDLWADVATTGVVMAGILTVTMSLYWLTPDPLDTWLGDDPNKNHKGNQ